LLDLSSELYAESVSAGNERLDMISVIKAIESRGHRGFGNQTSVENIARHPAE
jgi:hypothetical protein